MNLKNKENKKSNFNFEYYTYKNGKTINIKTGLEIKNENENNITHEEIEKIFFDMAYIIESNSKKYSKKYDELNGEGAYERDYRLTNNYYNDYDDYDDYEDNDYEDNDCNNSYNINNYKDYDDYNECNNLNFDK